MKPPIRIWKMNRTDRYIIYNDSEVFYYEKIVEPSNGSIIGKHLDNVLNSMTHWTKLDIDPTFYLEEYDNWKVATL